MYINELEIKDSVTATVIKTTTDNGAFLSIDCLKDECSPVVYLYDYIGRKGDKVLVSIAKISDDKTHIKTRLDSYIGSNDERLVA